MAGEWGLLATIASGYRHGVGPPPLPHQVELLRATLDHVTVAAAEGGPSPMVVFGLDGSLYDHRFRTRQILVDLAEEIAGEEPALAEALGGLGVEDIREELGMTLSDRGISDPSATQRISNIFRGRFASDAYLGHDRPAPGAVDYVGALYDAGAGIVYLTGRDRPGMLLGTVAALRDDGFPVAEPGVQLVMKPDATLSDEAFKQSALPQLARTGSVAAIFDADPSVCELGRAIFPEARVVMLSLTDFHYPAAESGVEVVGDYRIRV